MCGKAGTRKGKKFHKPEKSEDRGVSLSNFLLLLIGKSFLSSAREAYLSRSIQGCIVL